MKAKIYPLNQEPNNEGEKVAKEALGQLSSSFMIFNGLKWLIRYSGEGEIDFLLFHQNYGFLVLEVKGGSVTRQNENWIYASNKDCKNPIKQPRPASIENSQSNTTNKETS